MESTIMRGAVAIAFTCGFAGCHQPDQVSQAGKRDVPQASRPGGSLQRAALIAMDVEGVRSVVNNLVVMRGSG